jgi:hypothetical protein
MTDGRWYACATAAEHVWEVGRLTWDMLRRVAGDAESELGSCG